MSRNNALPATYRLGEYVIENVLGHGGFGITYLARDTKLSSKVAIKEYFPQAFALRDRQSTIVPTTGERENYRWGLQEFLKEARALAKFKHNHIVRVLRFLEANGTAYMVMEYEQGESLDTYLSKTGGFLNEPTLLSIFLPILGGLQAVHNAGLLHLDIKPENIYLRSNGQPMLIDFGSARGTKGKSKQDQKIALTPGYAAIEHYPNYGKKGPWTDVYSIGATLYRCITGTEPVAAMERYESMRARRPDPLRAAGSFDRPHYAAHIRNCIDWALKLSPRDRPHTAFALQRGLMGHGMSNELPTQQSTVNLRSGFIGIPKVLTVEEEQKVKRGIIEKTLIAVVVIAVVSIVPVKVLLQNESISDTDLFGVVDSVKASVARSLGLSKAEPIPPITRKASAKNNKTTPPKPIPSFNASKVLAHTLIGHAERVESLAFLLHGKLLASASADGVVKVWNVEAGTLTHAFDASNNAIGVLAVSPDGHWLALAGNDNKIKLWNASAGSTANELNGHTGSIRQMVFSPDGRTLASVSRDQSVILWDVISGQLIHHLRGYEHEILTVAFGPNGRRIATGDAAGEIRYWKTGTGKLAGYFQAHDDRITALAFSPDGKWLASGGADSFLKLWDTGLERDDRVLKGVPYAVQALSFTPDSEWLVAAGTSDAIKIWNVKSGEVAHQLYGRNNNIYALALSADGNLLAAGGESQVVEIWK
ncbi:MAG: serine/threonine-protein kinase [Acidiferrobacterales bacterium]|nr:serine/threonine-protein kinase [Acidiferrobacterales bacterium]